MCIRDSPHAALVLFRLVALLYRVFHLPLRQGSRGTDADTAYRAAGAGIKTCLLYTSKHHPAAKAG